MKPEHWRCMALVALGLGAASISAETLAKSRPLARATKSKAPEGPRPDIVGQVMLAKEGDPKKRDAVLPVVIQRGAERLENVGNYAPLYPKDRVFLKPDAAAPVLLQIFGGKEVRLGKQVNLSNAFEVPSAGGLWTMKGFGRLVMQFPDLFDPPRGRQPVLTTPNGTKGSDVIPVRPGDLLPATPQVLRVTRGKVVIPVVWSGGPALVRLSRECRMTVGEQVSGDPGFIELRASRLSEDQYCIDVWPIDARRHPDRNGGFSIPLTVTIEEPPTTDEETAVLAAAAALTGPAEGRLQGLVDIAVQAQTSFKALAIYRRAELGELRTAPAPPSHTRKRRRR